MPSIPATVLNNSAANKLAGIVRTNMGRAQDAVSVISTGSRLVRVGTDPASSAIYNKSLANIAVLEQAARNAAQGAGLTNVADTNTQKLLDLIRAGLVLTTEMNNDALTISERRMAQVMFFAYFGDPSDKTDRGLFMEIVDRSRWNDLKLFEGGGVAEYKAEANDYEVIRRPGTPLVDTFTEINPMFCGGMFEGQVYNVVVGATPIADVYEMSFRVGPDLFKSDGVTPLVANGEIFFTCAETGAQICLETAATITGLTNVDTVREAIKAYFGVGSEAPAILSSVTYETQDPNAATPAPLFQDTLTITLDKDRVSPGMYAGYVRTIPGATSTAPADLELVLTNSSTILRRPLTDFAAGTGSGATAPAVDLGNGITLTYGTVPISETSNFMFWVRNDKDLQFQTSSQSTDITIVSLPKITKDYLHLTNMYIETVEQAADATNKLTYALNEMNAVRARLGANQSAIQIAKESTEALIVNLKDAASTFNDADLTEAITEFRTSIQLTTISTSMIPACYKALDQIVRAVEQVANS
ncbi:MAG: flagellin [Alphaproteobacteria bacterium]